MLDSRRLFVNSVSSWFWEVIKEAKQDSTLLTQLLKKRSASEIERFCQDYWNVVYELYPSHFDAERNLLEDEILLASAWVVNQGQDYYEAVFQNPKLLPNPHTVVHLHWLDLASLLCYELYKYHPQL